MLLRLGGGAVPLESVIAILDAEAASTSEMAAFFADKKGPNGRYRSIVLAHENGKDALHYSSINARTLMRHANDDDITDEIVGG